MINMARASSTLVHRVRVLLLSCAAGVALSGGGSGGDRTPTQPPPEQPPPTTAVAVPGSLTARLVTPNADDGAILLDITGPAPAAEITAAVRSASKTRDCPPLG